MKIYATNVNDDSAFEIIQKALSRHFWVKIMRFAGNRSSIGYWYIQPFNIITAEPVNKKFFEVKCRCINAEFVDDYEFEGEVAFPSECIDTRDFDSWCFDVVSPVQIYTDAEMEEALAHSDEVYRQGYFDWWEEEPRRPREE